MRVVRSVLAVAVMILLAYGCATSTSSDTYSRDEATKTHYVYEGTVTGVRPVKIEGTRSGIGAGAGAVAGGVLGSTIGSGTGTTVAVVAGSLAGAAAGAAVEEGITKEDGLEITVKLDNGEIIAVAQKSDVQFAAGERVKVLRYSDGSARVTKY